MIEILAVGVAIDHGAAEFQIANAALEFVGRGLRVLHGKMREAAIAVGALLDFLGEKVVTLARDLRRLGGIGLDLHAGACDRQHRYFDAGRVHRGEALLAEVVQARQHLSVELRVHILHGLEPIGLETGRQKVLFERDLFHADARQGGLNPACRSSLLVYRNAVHLYRFL